MIDFMNAIGPSVVAFCALPFIGAVITYGIYRASAGAMAERQLKYSSQDESLRFAHTEKMANLKLIESRPVELKS